MPGIGLNASKPSVGPSLCAEKHVFFYRAISSPYPGILMLLRHHFGILSLLLLRAIRCALLLTNLRGFRVVVGSMFPHAAHAATSACIGRKSASANASSRMAWIRS